MEPHSTFGGLFLLAIKQQLSFIAITQALVVAGITATATGYVTVQVLQREVSYIREVLDRHEREARSLTEKVSKIEVRQAGVISQADTIHDNIDKRVQALEARRK